MNAPLPAVAVTATLVEIAQALGVTKQAVAQRATREAWPFDEVAIRGGRRRLYPLATLPAEGLEGAEFSGDGSRLVGFGSSGVHVWQVSSAEMRADLDRRLGGNTYSDQECAVYRIEPCPAG